eukprot:g24986.t1
MLALWLLLALGAIHCSAIPKRSRDPRDRRASHAESLVRRVRDLPVIWSFWHDSESVPKLVRLAMATWHHFAPDYEVTMLDLRSFAAHLESAQRLGPEDFSNMVFFADWLRLALLESHGRRRPCSPRTAPLHFLVNDSARLSGVQLEASLFETFLIAVSSPHDVFIQRWKDTLREIFSLSEILGPVQSSYDQHLTQLRGRGIEPLNGAMANCDWSHASPIHSAAHALLHLFARAVNSLAAFTHYYLHPCGQRYWMHYLKTNVVFNSIIGTHGGNVLELYKKWGIHAEDSLETVSALALSLAWNSTEIEAWRDGLNMERILFESVRSCELGSLLCRLQRQVGASIFSEVPDAYFVLYEITPDGTTPAPSRIDRLAVPLVSSPESFVLVAEGDLVEAKDLEAKPKADAEAAADELGPLPAKERTTLTTPVTELPDKEEEVKAQAERKPIKGIPAVEFRARCDLIFDKYDKDGTGILCFEEPRPTRNRPKYDAYASLCQRLGCDARLGLTRKDVYKLFEKAPQAVWEEVYRSINPLAQMVKKGADRLPETFLERPVTEFLFEDEEQFAKVHVELNAHLYYGAAEVISNEHVQAYFGKQRLELHIVAPGSYGAKDLYLWKMIITPLSGEIDSLLELKATTGRFGSQKLTLKLMKSKKKRWYKVGQAATGQRI